MAFEQTRDEEETLRQYLELEPENLSKQEICRRLKMSTATLYKFLKKWHKEGRIEWPQNQGGKSHPGAGRPKIDRRELLDKFLGLRQSEPHHKIASELGINVMTFYRVVDEWKKAGWVKTAQNGQLVPTEAFKKTRVELAVNKLNVEVPMKLTRNQMLEFLLKVKQLEECIEEMLADQ